MAKWSIDDHSLKAFREGIVSRGEAPEWFRLRRDIEQLALKPGFDRLITLDHNTIKELPHQIKVAEQVLSRPMMGRAILADEVGLGKTIEAGIILKELKVRGLARRVLILTPAALVGQWLGELEEKFFERFETPVEPDDWARMPRVIASISQARHKRHRQRILEQRWDLVIVDEAHKIKNHKSSAYQLVSDLERNYILLLTATPLQNDLRELYNLVTLLRPGQMGTWTEFRRQYMIRGDKRKPRNPDAIRELTAEVMVRTRRANVADSVRLPPREPLHPRVHLSPAETGLYRETVAFLRELYRRGFYTPDSAQLAEDRRRRKLRTGKGVQELERIRLCRRLCSSSVALSTSLRALSEGELLLPDFRLRARELAAAAAEVDRHAKLDILLSEIGRTDDRVVVFSEHRPTIQLISTALRKLGRRPVLFHGGMARRERARSLASFREDPASVFVATKAGTEGLNLQFCNRLVNYDLPWNPMVVEQRIGRIHRIGQERTTYIINLAAVGTVEERVLQLLNEKIRLFELVVGELDVILGEFGGAESLEQKLVHALLDAEDDQDFDRSLVKLGEEIEKSRQAGLNQEKRNSELMVEDAAERLRREFRTLTAAARVRLAYGTSEMITVRGLEAKRHRLGLHVNEILEAMGAGAHAEGVGTHPEYGPMQRLVGVTGRGRAVVLTVQADKLPMVLVDIEADEEAPLVA